MNLDQRERERQRERETETETETETERLTIKYNTMRRIYKELEVLG